jgi:hypothetical protein
LRVSTRDTLAHLFLAFFILSLTAGRSSSSSLVISPRYLKSRTVSISISPIVKRTARAAACSLLMSLCRFLSVPLMHPCLFLWVCGCHPKSPQLGHRGNSPSSLMMILSFRCLCMKWCRVLFRSKMAWSHLGQTPQHRGVAMLYRYVTSGAFASSSSAASSADTSV